MFLSDRWQKLMCNIMNYSLFINPAKITICNHNEKAERVALANFKDYCYA